MWANVCHTRIKSRCNRGHASNVNRCVSINGIIIKTSRCSISIALTIMLIFAENYQIQGYYNIIVSA